jgi:hypothetical protein
LSAAGAAFGIVGAALPLMAGLIVLDTVAGMARCTTCGYQNQNTETVKRHIKSRHPKQVEQKRDMFDFGGVDEALGSSPVW